MEPFMQYTARGFWPSQTGVEKWEFMKGYDISTSPIVRQDGLIYLGTDGVIASLTPDGKDYGNPFNVYSSSDAIALDKNGTFYFFLHSVNLDQPVKSRTSSGDIRKRVEKVEKGSMKDVS
jgi:hypothetical protein